MTQRREQVHTDPTVPDSSGCNFVVYLLLEKGFTEQWVSHIDGYLLRWRPVSTVLIGDHKSRERFHENCESDVRSDPVLRVNPSSSGFYHDLATFHGLHYKNPNLLLIGSDVFIAGSDPDVFARTLRRNSNVGTVSPVTEQGKLFGLFERRQSVLSLELTGNLLQRIENSAGFESPFFYPGMVYWRSHALYAVLSSDRSPVDVIDLAVSTGLAGYLHVVTPGVFVHDRSRRAARDLKKIDKNDLSQTVIRRHPLTRTRHRMADLVVNVQVYRNENPDPPGPVQLHVMHSWGGGLHRWVSNYNDADSNGINYTLKSIGDWEAFGKRLSLYRHPDDEQAIRYWDLYSPIHATALAHFQYGQIVNEIIRDYGIDLILVSSLIGHSLDILNTDVRTAMVLHDYYPFCPAIYIYFDGICNTCDGDRLRKCQAKNPLNFLFKGIEAEQWLAVRKRYISFIRKNGTLLIAPSPSVTRHFRSLMPELNHLDFNCIPHGLPDHLEFVHKVNPRRDKRLKILVPGKLDPHKGLDLSLKIAAEIGVFADLIFLGCGEAGNRFSGIDGVTIEPLYEYAELTNRLHFHAPDLALMFPIWPETFNYTLSEVMIHAIPTVVSARGAPMDRILDQENGFLVDPEPRQILELLRALAEHPERLDAVRYRLIKESFRSASTMVADYKRLLGGEGTEFLNSYAMMCLSENPPQIGHRQVQTAYIGEGDFFVVMQQLENHLIGMVNKVPGIGRIPRKFFTMCIKLWIYFPVRFALLYVRRK